VPMTGTQSQVSQVFGDGQGGEAPAPKAGAAPTSDSCRFLPIGLSLRARDGALATIRPSEVNCADP
jgi:hypothetical protein